MLDVMCVVGEGDGEMVGKAAIDCLVWLAGLDSCAH